MNDYTQPSALKHVDTVSQNAESLKFGKEMSDGPYESELVTFPFPGDDYSIVLGPGMAENHPLSCIDEDELNIAYHEGRKSRDSELAAKDARIKELESQVKELDSLTDRCKTLIDALSELYKDPDKIGRCDVCGYWIHDHGNFYGDNPSAWIYDHAFKLIDRHTKGGE
jgi:hypothetical protein